MSNTNHRFPNREGERVPDVSLRVRRNGDWATLTSADLFANKNVIVFSLPGAFTPTCSSTHLPRYNELAPAFKAAGIDTIVCVSVNDPFVMEAWAKDQEAGNVTLLPDGNGEFTRKMGLLVDKSAVNFGQRSWRYSMLVRDGVIEKMFIEPDEPGDPFVVSDADTMLNYLNPNAKKPDQVAILTREGCSFCAKAKRLLTEAGIAYADVPLNHAVRTKVIGAITGAQTVPQVFINGRLIGNAEDLERYLKRAA
ncbi:MAG TPA: glutathione peroxidase [Casimicrobiaceae bacterium]|nr:glutathione peroxidase [Casimicrobiaceae bacterium]